MRTALETQRKRESQKKASKGINCSDGAELVTTAQFTQVWVKKSNPWRVAHPPITDSLLWKGNELTWGDIFPKLILCIKVDIQNSHQP